MFLLLQEHTKYFEKIELGSIKSNAGVWRVAYRVSVFKPSNVIRREGDVKQKKDKSITSFFYERKLNCNHNDSLNS